MTEDLEARLRAALRPTSPSEDFSEKLLARLAATQAQTRRLSPTLRRHAVIGWLSASLAAAVLVTVGIGVQRHMTDVHQRAQELQAHRQEEARRQGLEARRQVLEALRVTDQKLDLAYQVVRNQSSSVDNPGI